MNKRELAKKILIIVLPFVIAHLGGLIFPGVIRWADSHIHNLFFHLRHFMQEGERVSPYLLLFAIDDKFEAKYNTPGRERIKIAEALGNIKEMGAGTVLMDVIFRERDNTIEEDLILAESTQSCGNIFYPLSVKRNGKPGREMPEIRPPGSLLHNRPGRVCPAANLLSHSQLIFEQSLSIPRIRGYATDCGVLWPLKVTRPGRPIRVGGGTGPSPELARAVRGLGGITLFPGNDGIIRRIPLVYSFRDKFIPSLVLAGICHFYQVEPGAVSVAFGKRILLEDATGPGGQVKDIRIPVDDEGQMLVNFTGPWKGSVTSFSLENMLTTGGEAREPPNSFPAEKPRTLVLIGDITTASKDITRGIFEPNYPMAGIIHNSLNTILTEKYLYRPGFIEQLLISILFAGILLLIQFGWKKNITTSGLFLFFLLFLAILYGLFFTIGRLPDIFLYFSAFVLLGGGILKQELDEVKKQITTDDALTIDGDTLPEGEREDRAKLMIRRMKKLGLRESQIKVAGSLLEGLQYKEIACQLEISTTATAQRIYRMYQRLGVNNKIEFSKKVYEVEIDTG